MKDSRVKNVLAQMGKNNLSRSIVTSPESIYYLT